MSAATLRLPTLATFQRWPIEKRTALFVRWLKTQPRKRPLDYWEIERCPLARFGKRLTRKATTNGGGESFYVRRVHRPSDRIQVLPEGYNALRQLGNAQPNATYGELAIRLSMPRVVATEAAG